MDKAKVKIEIEKLKVKLSQVKITHKKVNDNNKIQLDGMKSILANQTTPSARQSAKKRIEMKKDQMSNIKKNQASEVDKIKDQIEKYKKML